MSRAFLLLIDQFSILEPNRPALQLPFDNHAERAVQVQDARMGPGPGRVERARGVPLRLGMDGERMLDLLPAVREPRAQDAVGADHPSIRASCWRSQRAPASLFQMLPMFLSRLGHVQPCRSRMVTTS